MNATEVDTIVIRVLGGEIDAYEEIVRAFQQEVWKVVAAMLFNVEKTEDLVQQTFIQCVSASESISKRTGLCGMVERNSAKPGTTGDQEVDA